jgi:arylsulfatase A-like enzyme
MRASRFRPLALLAALCTLALVIQPIVLVLAQSVERRNIILIVTDDQDFRSLQQMPKTRELIEREGATFKNFVVSTPGCCPSRASILRGQYTRNHGVRFSDGPDGGHETFRALGHERSTLATWLQDQGYRTAMVGKYLNGYGEDGESRVPPGWEEWYAATSLKYFDYEMVENGRIVRYGSKRKDYVTDVLSAKARAFVEESAQAEQPFFLYLAPRAPHGPATPAPRHQDRFNNAKAPRTSAFNESDVGDKPTYVRESPRLNRNAIRQLDALYRNRLRTLLAVDDMVAGLFQTLEETNTLANTYVFFTSDNGYLLGEHRRAEKGMPYEEAIRVPLLVRGPGVVTRQIADLAANIDLAPTIAELTGAVAPDFVDGRSLVPLLEGRAPPSWRQVALVEAFGRDEEVAALEIGDGAEQPAVQSTSAAGPGLRRVSAHRRTRVVRFEDRPIAVGESGGSSCPRRGDCGASHLARSDVELWRASVPGCRGIASIRAAGGAAACRQHPVFFPLCAGSGRSS